MEEIKLNKCTIGAAMREVKSNIKNKKDVIVTFIDKATDNEHKISVVTVPPEVKVDENGEKWMKVR